ncbi:MAG: hypothetical protein IK093_06115 [Ruminiclostridium sp.]|nr:hypothetical protein [Ruminiclostridium sp.]
MKASPAAKQTAASSSMLIPVFAAVALIISAAVYIVFKLTQQTAYNKWAEYDDCGWS